MKKLFGILVHPDYGYECDEKQIKAMYKDNTPWNHIGDTFEVQSISVGQAYSSVCFKKDPKTSYNTVHFIFKDGLGNPVDVCNVSPEEYPIDNPYYHVFRKKSK